jgi:hypothetical protein
MILPRKSQVSVLLRTKKNGDDRFLSQIYTGIGL